MKYICETCNKQHNTISEAEKCEAAHVKEKLIAQAQESAEHKINEALNAFIARYKKMPNIELTESNQKILFGDISDKIEKTLDTIIGIIFGDGEDECGDCDGCDCCHNKKAE